MPVYAKKVSTGHSTFQNRNIVIAGGGSVDTITVPNNVVLCNGCNGNQAETEEKEIYLVYLGKRELKANQPYDSYCGNCLKRYFPKAEMVT